MFVVYIESQTISGPNLGLTYKGVMIAHREVFTI